MEEKAFVTSLHTFMKDRATPIERIPHLGFKQINLWRIFKAVEKLGGYDSVTSRRLWKKVYDELGGSPGSTSAATCTRRHYEKLVLPFERHIKGEEDKPLPLSKPRKPYKRSSDSKLAKTEKRRKRSQLEIDVDSEMNTPQSPEISCQSEVVIHSRCTLWNSSQHLPDGSQPKRAHNTTIYTHLAPVPTCSPWSQQGANVPSVVGEVISPLEKKKRMAQASLNISLSSLSEDKERPSVIHCSQSPSRASSNHNCTSSSDSSPLPLSSSSSRSPSPYSVSSEDGPEGGDSKPATELLQNSPSSVKSTSSSSSEDRKSASCTQVSKDPVEQRKDSPRVCAQSTDLIQVQGQESAWRPVRKESRKYLSRPFQPQSPYSVISDWPTSASSFTKVIPSSVQLLRPAPVRPACKFPRSMQQGDSLTSAKKQSHTGPWIYHTDKREKPRTMQQKVSLTQHSASHSASSVTGSSALSSYERSGGDSRHQPLFNPTYLCNRMRLPPSQLMYRHGSPQSAIIGSTSYPYPYSIPLWSPQLGYTLPALTPIYPYKM
ncbi:AT-rich interactive domain-containing protein 5A isoform X1 [Xyrichtys novacula]|nr:AT-rich interactive domain-containing protein 5A isoform X1 [Xyrichtys novacula]